MHISLYEMCISLYEMKVTTRTERGILVTQKSQKYAEIGLLGRHASTFLRISVYFCVTKKTEKGDCDVQKKVNIRYKNEPLKVSISNIHLEFIKKKG